VVKFCREDRTEFNVGELYLAEERSLERTNRFRVSGSESCRSCYRFGSSDVISRLVGDVQRVPEVQRRTSSQRVTVKSSKKGPSYCEIIPLLASERHKACLALTVFEDCTVNRRCQPYIVHCNWLFCLIVINIYIYALL